MHGVLRDVPDAVEPRDAVRRSDYAWVNYGAGGLSDI